MMRRRRSALLPLLGGDDEFLDGGGGLSVASTRGGAVGCLSHWSLGDLGIGGVRGKHQGRGRDAIKRHRLPDHKGSLPPMRLSAPFSGVGGS